MERRFPGERSRYETPLLLATIMLALITRLGLMATQPLTDQTEARYGELARVTADGGYWLMPHIATGEPFLAKPPLATWLSALSWKFLGENEFCLRLPSFLATIATGWLLLASAHDFGIGSVGKWMIAACLATSPISITCAGSVMTDAPQLLVVTAAMLSAWRAINGSSGEIWRLIFWGTLGVATLSKGLATLALIGIPLIGFSFTEVGFRPVIRGLWSLRGCLLAIAIALAWYVPAELAYPGFLKYFLIGEHFQRFLQPNWAGDRFGHAHSVPFGTIWLYWAAATLFWFPVMIESGVRTWRGSPAGITRSDRWLWCWILTPLLFFTFARNILWTYTLTVIPPFALFVGRWSEEAVHWGRRTTPALLAAGGGLAFLLCVAWAPERFESRSARSLVRQVARMEPRRQSVHVAGGFQFSSRFYTRGHAIAVDTPDKWDAVLHQPVAVLIAPRSAVQTELASGRVRLVAEESNSVLVEITEPRYAAK